MASCRQLTQEQSNGATRSQTGLSRAGPGPIAPSPTRYGCTGPTDRPAARLGGQAHFRTNPLDNRGTSRSRDPHRIAPRATHHAPAARATDRPATRLGGQAHFRTTLDNRGTTRSMDPHRIGSRASLEDPRPARQPHREDLPRSLLEILPYSFETHLTYP